MVDTVAVTPVTRAAAIMAAKRPRAPRRARYIPCAAPLMTVVRMSLIHT
jgi:hypothetical protein